MTAADVKQLLVGMPGAVEDRPFGEQPLVFKVGDKMFALLAEDDNPARISLKCDPDLALELRAQYPEGVTPGYYMNKRHWNTVILNGTVAHDDLRSMITHSYQLIVNSLTRAQRAALPVA